MYSFLILARVADYLFSMQAILIYIIIILIIVLLLVIEIMNLAHKRVIDQVDEVKGREKDKTSKSIDRISRNIASMLTTKDYLNFNEGLIKKINTFTDYLDNKNIKYSLNIINELDIYITIRIKQNIPFNEALTEYVYSMVLNDIEDEFLKKEIENKFKEIFKL